MQIAYARSVLPQSIFLAGPTPRDAETPSWRPQAIELLKQEGFEGTVLVPEDGNGSAKFSYDDQIEWEMQALNMATAILFWIPRQMPNMPAMTTNVEFGHFIARRNVVVGIPETAVKCNYLRGLAAAHNHRIHTELRFAARYAIHMANRPFITS